MITTDVGGGSAKDSEPHALSNVSLRWMVREAVKAQCGIAFDETMTARWNIPKEDLELSSMARRPSGATVRGGPTSQRHVNSGEEHHSAHGVVTSRVSDASAFQQVFDTADALQDKVDELSLNLKNLKGLAWWVLEISPTVYEWQDEDGRWWKRIRRVFLPASAPCGCTD